MADLTITATSVEVQNNAASILSKFGEAVTPGQVVYRSTSDSKYYLADCDDAAKSNIAGIAITYAAADSFGYVFTANGRDIDLGATLVSGEIYIVSDTAGNIMPYADLTTGQYLTILGFAKSTSLLTLDINNTGLTKA
jgi:hypothetical protein